MKQLKKVLVLLITAILLVTVCACGKSPASDQGTETKTVTDSLNRQVEVPVKVDRIVTLSNVPRMAVYLGLTDKIVGYSGMEPEKVQPLTAYAYAVKDELADVPIVGTDAGGNTDYYPEAIIEAAPDVILCGYPEDVVKELEEQTGIPVVSVAMGNIFEEDYDEALRVIAKTCGVEDRAEEVIAYVDDCLKDIDNRTKDIPDADKPSVLSAAATFKGAHGIKGVRIADPVLTALHANNVAAQDTDNKSTAVEVDKEQILDWNPDYIFCDYSGVPLVKQDMSENPSFYKNLKAFNEGKMYQHPSSTSYYANLEISLANAYFIGSVLYPEQFSDIQIHDKANDIFEFFLGEKDYMSELEGIGAQYSVIQ